MPRKGIISVDNKSSKPKYKQIVDSVKASIENGRLKQGQQLPSIARVASGQHLAKVTVAKGYDILCEKGIITPRQGKGFYIAKTSVKAEFNIFLLFDTFNQYKEILYSSFKEALPPATQFSIFFHHYNKDVFESLIKNSIGKYTHYVIMPHFKEDVSKIINCIPPDKLLVLDQYVRHLKEGASVIYQPFRKDVVNGLTAAKDLIKKYNKLHLILGESHFQYVPVEAINGFKYFAKKENIDYAVEKDLDENNIRKNDAYLFFSDPDIIRFVKSVEMKKMKIKRDIGMISYDDTPLKEILLGGVSVISTDFKKMGRTAAEAILGRKTVKQENPGYFIKRKTL